MIKQISIPPELSAALVGHHYLGRRRGYKFHHSADTAAILDGSVKLGRYAEYRKHPLEALRDENEGAVVLRVEQMELGLGRFVESRNGPSDHSMVVPLRPVHPRSAFRKFTKGLQCQVVMRGCTFREEFDAHMFCFSYECNERVLQSFQGGKPYDAVVEIDDVEALAQSIVRRHNMIRGWRYLCLPVIYRDPIRTERDPEPHSLLRAFEKDPSFAANAEGRILFLPPQSGDRLLQRKLLDLKPFTHERFASRFWEAELPAAGRPQAFVARADRLGNF